MQSVITMTDVEWKRVMGYDVRTDGRVRHADGRMLEQHITKAGYKYVNVRVAGRGKKIFVHRMVALAHIPNPHDKPWVDHIDRNTLNNDVSNLRWCTRAENMQNRPAVQGSRSRFRGVSWHIRGRKWEARIHTSDRQMCRLCDSELDAARLYNEWAAAAYGEFAYINDV